MSVRYGLFVPDAPGPDRMVADLSVRFPRALAQGRRLATHYGPESYVAHIDGNNQPLGAKHRCYQAPRTTIEVNREQLRQVVKPARQVFP